MTFLKTFSELHEKLLLTISIAKNKDSATYISKELDEDFQNSLSVQSVTSRWLFWKEIWELAWKQLEKYWPLYSYPCMTDEYLAMNGWSTIPEFY